MTVSTAVTITCLLILAFLSSPFVSQMRILVQARRNRLTNWRDRVQYHFCGLGPHAFSFAWCKLRWDSMFDDLPQWLPPAEQVRTILDLGCGIGVAGSWMLERYPDATIFGVDPDANRIKVAANAFAPRGQAAVAGAPDFEVPGMPERFDLMVCLDVIYHITNAQLQLTLDRMHAKLKPGGKLILRTVIPPQGKGSLLWNTDKTYRKVTGDPAHFRSADAIAEMIKKAGFSLAVQQRSSTNPELTWFIGVSATTPAPQ